MISKLRSPQFCSLLFGSGYLALASIHWWHSWPAISDGYLYSDLGDDGESDPLIEACETLTLLFLFTLYILCLVKWERWQFKTRELVIMLIAPSIFAWSALPANSTDIFAYIGMGRVAGIYGANPYLHTYSEFADEFYSFVTWDVTMSYGPVLLPIFILAGKLSEHSVILSVFFLKFVWLLTHCGNCWVLYRILKTWRPDPSYGLFLFALNPLVLLEHIANGHNDGMMIFWGLLAIRALQLGRYNLAVWLAVTSTLVKLPGIFFLLVILVYLFRRRKWRELTQSLLGGVALLLALRATLFPTVESLTGLTNPGMEAKNSIHALLIDLIGELSHQFGAPISHGTLHRIDRRIFSVLLPCFCLWRAWQIRRVDDLNGLVRELQYILLALLIGYTAWFFPWYVTWVVPLAALADSHSLRWAIVTFSWTVLSLYSFPVSIVEQAPLPWLWATLRIAIAHCIPLLLMIRNAIGLEKSWKVWRGLEKSGGV